MPIGRFTETEVQKTVQHSNIERHSGYVLSNFHWNEWKLSWSPILSSLNTPITKYALWTCMGTEWTLCMYCMPALKWSHYIQGFSFWNKLKRHLPTLQRVRRSGPVVSNTSHDTQHAAGCNQKKSSVVVSLKLVQGKVCIKYLQCWDMKGENKALNIGTPSHSLHTGSDHSIQIWAKASAKGCWREEGD